MKSVSDLNIIFLFALVADPNINQSPIYHEFIKFYLQVPSEELKVKFQIDLEKSSIIEALKQYVGRMAQRGFFSRSPSYHRNLNIVETERVLLRLVSRR